MLFKKKKYIKADYNLTYDNLAIPEIHTKKETIHTSTDPNENRPSPMMVWRFRKSILKPEAVVTAFI